MIIKVKSIEELKNEFLLAITNTTNKVTKILPTSVLNGIAYGFAKLTQKINKEAALIESKLFPEYAIGTDLDDIALREGIPARLTATKSTVVLVFTVDISSGDVIIKAGSVVSGYNNINFETDTDLIITQAEGSGIGYVFASSQQTGKNNNVGAYSINRVVSLAFGSSNINKIQAVTNPSSAINGFDNESDYDFRKRILTMSGIIGTNTYENYLYYIQYFQPEVLRIKTTAISLSKGTFEIFVVKRNAGYFNNSELNDLKNNIISYLPLRDANIFTFNISNVLYKEFDVYAKVYIDGSRTLLQIAQDWSIAINNYINHKEWPFGKKVDHEMLMSMLQDVQSVLDIDDDSFEPRRDVFVKANSLPKLRSIVLYNAETGQILDKQFPILRNYEINGNINPIIQQQQNLE